MVEFAEVCYYSLWSFIFSGCHLIIEAHFYGTEFILTLAPQSDIF